MKKLLLLFLISVAFVSCDDIQTNEFAIQAKVGERLYTSTEASATVEANGRVKIEGSTLLESLTIRLGKLKEGSFIIGPGYYNKATFEDMDGNVYQTEPDGTGLVIISHLNETYKTLSGSFHFVASRSGIDSIYVSQGVLYNVPYTGDSTGIPVDAGTFSAMVNDLPFVATEVTAVKTADIISISGSTVTEKIIITVPSDVAIGNHPLSDPGFSAKYQDTLGIEAATGGIISITEHNILTKKIKATFSFLTQENTISEGQFEVTYQ